MCDEKTAESATCTFDATCSTTTSEGIENICGKCKCSMYLIGSDIKLYGLAGARMNCDDVSNEISALETSYNIDSLAELDSSKKPFVLNEIGKGNASWHI